MRGKEAGEGAAASCQAPGLIWVTESVFLLPLLRPGSNGIRKLLVLSSSVKSNSLRPWTVVCQTPLCIGFPKQEHWSGLSFPPLGDLPDPGIELVSPALQDKAGDRARTWAEESQPRRRPQSSPDAPQTGVRLSLSSSHSSFLHFVLSSF